LKNDAEKWKRNAKPKKSERDEKSGKRLRRPKRRLNQVSFLPIKFREDGMVNELF
jgi:hypothetical protein